MRVSKNSVKANLKMKINKLLGSFLSTGRDSAFRDGDNAQDNRETTVNNCERGDKKGVLSNMGDKLCLSKWSAYK